MNLQIYKSFAHPDSYNAGTIYYAVRDLDLPEHNPCIMISLRGKSWSLYTQMFPQNINNPNSPPTSDPQESSFMDLLLTTGIVQSQIEYIFTNLDFDSHTISIQPRFTSSSPTPTTSSAKSSHITLSSSFGHTKPINI
jgi:hypothetical protein